MVKSEEWCIFASFARKKNGFFEQQSLGVLSVLYIIVSSNLRAKGKEKEPIRPYRLFYATLLVGLAVILNCYDLLVLVVTASLANTVSKVVLAALRALNEVGRSCELPNAGASLHLSRMRNFSLWYCHL